jgi:hypothetical protein
MSVHDFDNMPELPGELAAALRADAVERSERPDEFWSRQRSGIRARMHGQSHRRPHGIRLALAGAALIFLAVLLTAPAGRPPQVVPQAKVDADQQLLLAVEHALAMGTPEALEPLTLLVESGSNPHDSETISNKERRNEN